MVSPVVKILGYSITEELYNGSRTIVYRGYRDTDLLPVVIKLLKNPYPTFNELLSFRNQYTITKNLNSPLIVKTYSLEPYQNGYVLVMEDFGGISLKEWTDTDKQKSLQEFLLIAIAVCNILDILYRERILHKDIKPSNILINPETKQIKLIDFSIASLLPRESQTLINPNVLEGSLAYISPEQTGRMNRGIDYRTDFYSLGVAFYELLTGELPFQSNDPMELVHCHIVKMPTALENREDIPQVLCDIVMKLMAKNAEDRYQSALGLKADLEICLDQLKETGKIESFKIGQRDVCDRFLIPDKLYGREQEVQMLLEGFERVANGVNELMLVAGFSGIGKTAVVNEVHKPIVQWNGYFIKGKYDQFNRNIPFSAFVQAFRDLMKQLLSESDEQLAQWKDKILQALAENGQLMIEVIPELEQIIGKQSPVPELLGKAAQNRFNLLFQKFINVFTTKEHPLVIFLDDLQWADSASLNLMQVLLSGTEQGYLLIIGAYRDNEVFKAHPLMLTLEEIKKAQIISTLTLNPLSQSHINCLIADTLSCSSELALPLTKLIYQKTKGNPFFTTQFLRALYEDGYIAFDPQAGHWQCDIATVRTLTLTDDVVEFMALQLQKLPDATQSVLKLAACIGAVFDLGTLAIISEQSPETTAVALWKALQEGLILPQSDVYKFYQIENIQLNNGSSLKSVQSTPQQLAQTQSFVTDSTFDCSYRFLHDRVQQAAYSLIPSDHKQATHLKIGQLLQQNLSEVEKQEKLFDIVGHLNLGIELITQPSQRQALAQLNLAAAHKARNSTAYSAARNFVQTGLQLLSAGSWHSQYELTLNLYVAAAETAYLNADFASMEAMAALVLQSAQTILDKVKIYQIQISALTIQSQMLEAIAFAKVALTQLGVELPTQINPAIIGEALQALDQQLQGKEIAELNNLPLMSDPTAIAAMELLAMLFSPAFQASPDLLPLLCSTMVSLSLQFGNTPASTMGYAVYGVVLCDFLKEVEKGYNFGRVGLNLLNQLDVRQLKPLVLLWVSSCIQHRTEPLTAVILMLKQAYLAGMETGDYLSAGYSILNYFSYNFFAGACLYDWEPEIENYCVVLGAIKQDSALPYLKMTQQLVHNWREIVNQPDLLIGTVYDETVMISKYHKDNDLTALAYVYVYKLALAYFFGNYTNALDYIAQTNLYLIAVPGLIQNAVFPFYAGLTYLAQCSGQSEIEQVNNFALAQTYQTNLAHWAHHAPMNHQHKLDLVEAEKCRVLGQKAAAIEFYDKAIFGAKANNYIQEEALANELAAKFYLEWGKQRIAGEYMINAYYAYARWGAKAKTADLEQRYPQLLAPILQQTRPTLLVNETFFATRTLTSSCSSGSISNSLDLASILKASHAISSEIELEKLLSLLLRIVIENAGADKCVLMLRDTKHEQMLIEGFMTVGTQPIVLQHLPIDNSQDIPLKLIYKVKNEKQTAVLSDAMANPLLANDPYIITQQPKSLLCNPILYQGNLLGMLYLENSLVAEVFTSDRIELLNLLCTQAAISLENAQLYERSQQYAQQLEQALYNLQNAQLQIVQSEKMSALGNLVAGVAHEMNNPLSFITASLQEVKPTIADIFEHLKLYQENCPNQSEEIINHAEEVDLEYSLEDLPKVIDSMTIACNRLKNISTSLCTFSRADKDYKVPFNIHEGIDSTILILKHRLKANEQRPAIEVKTEYAELPKISCFPGQLNQVFMNIIANAIDALEESNIQRNWEEIKANPNQIKIITSWQNNLVKISIIDNGIGMNESVRQKIFDHLFTTKAVGKGTGLGLAIAQQIIVEKHGGSLQCNSSVGQGTEFIILIPIQ